MKRVHFWPLYSLASLVSAGISLALFRYFALLLDRPYEESAIVAGLLALPVNWLWGEQITWRARPNGRGRTLRALRYFVVYAAGLAIDAALVHAVGHVLRADARWSEVVGVTGSMLWTAPANRLLVWPERSAPRVSDASSAVVDGLCGESGGGGDEQPEAAGERSE